MTLADRLLTGFNLTVLGMGLVFLLLALLWGLLVLMLRMDRVPPEADAGEAAASQRRQAARIAPELLTAITVAVLTHRSVQRKQAAPAMRSYWPGSILFASRWVAAGRHQQTQSWRPGKR